MICHFLCCPRLFLHNTCRTSDGAAGLDHGRVYAMFGGVTISKPDCNVTVGVMFWFAYFFRGLLHSWDLHKEETMVFEAHCMSFPCTELSYFNDAKVNIGFHLYFFDFLLIMQIVYINQYVAINVAYLNSVLSAFWNVISMWYNPKHLIQSNSHPYISHWMSFFSLR